MTVLNGLNESEEAVQFELPLFKCMIEIQNATKGNALGKGCVLNKPCKRS